MLHSVQRDDDKNSSASAVKDDKNNDNSVPSQKRRRILRSWLHHQAPNALIDPVNFVSLAPEGFPDVLDQEAVFAKLCRFMKIDPYDESKTTYSIWNQRRSLRPSNNAPLFTPSYLFTEEMKDSSFSSARFPRLSLMFPPEDPRRKMGVACLKAGNMMGDREAFNRMLHKYFCQNVQWENRYVGSKNPYGPQSVRLDGLDAVARYYDTVAFLIPDVVNHFQGCDIILRPDGSAIIVVQHLSYGTKMFRSQTESCAHVVVDKEGQAMGVPLQSMSEVSSLTAPTMTMMNTSIPPSPSPSVTNHHRTVKHDVADSTHKNETVDVNKDTQQMSVDGSSYPDMDVQDEDDMGQLEELLMGMVEEAQAADAMVDNGRFINPDLADVVIDTDEDDDMSSQMQKLNIGDIELLPAGEQCLKLATLNMSISYSYPFHTGAPSPEDAGKIYQVTLLHTAAIEMT